MPARARSSAAKKTAASKPAPPDAPAAVRPPADVIEVRGARQNNLRGIDVDIPLGQITVVTGPSGSGKSSLAFDTIYAEGQRRYIETFSPYVRQFFERMDKPQVDDIRGIPPAIAIEQSNAVRTTRSTVGTMTEINDYLKLLFPRLATASCSSCHQPVRPDTPQSAAAQVARDLAGREVLVLFGVPAPPDAQPADFFAFLQGQGFLRARVLGKIYRTDEPEAFDRKALPGVVEVVQDRIRLEARPSSDTSALSDSLAPSTTRLHEALEAAFHFGKGRARVIDAATGEGPHFSRGWHCAACDISLREPTPALFSFNNPIGACPVCRGFGRVIGIDLDRAMPDKSLSIREGLVRAFSGNTMAESQKDLMRAAKGRGVDVDAPYDELPPEHQRWIIEGDNKDPEEAWRDGQWYGVRGFFKWCESRLYKMHIRVFLSRYRAYTTCETCGGGRLQPEALNFRVGGATLPDWWRTPVSSLRGIIASHAAEKNPHSAIAGDPTAEMLRAEIGARLGYLDRVGLGYLTLDRAARTLSGGEVERVNLTSCLGASLVNTLFVMDEPSVGLHPRDVGRMIDVMRDLRDKGNTLLVVEHEESVIRAADHLLDIGPGRGQDGGQLVYAGPVAARRGSGAPAAERSGETPAFPFVVQTDDFSAEERTVAENFAAQLSQDPEAFARDYEAKFPGLLDLDAIRYFCPEYAASPENRTRFTRATKEVAGQALGYLFDRWIARPSRTGLVRFNAGGMASGKTTATTVSGDLGLADFTIDTTFGNRRVSEGAVRAALDSGRMCHVRFVFAPFAQAVRCMLERALGEAGRYVSIRSMASAHFHAPRNALDLRQACGERLLLDVIDNTGFQPVRRDEEWLRQQLPPSIDTLASMGKELVHEFFQQRPPANQRETQLKAFVLGHTEDDPEGTRGAGNPGSHQESAGSRGAPEEGAAPAGQSLTLAYLSGEKAIPTPAARRPRQRGNELRLIGATQHNLRKLNVTLPLGLFVCVTGVSGSGKSTLIHDVLYENLIRLKGQSSENEPGQVRELSGAEAIADVVMVDQSPLSRTPRSTPAVYIGAWDAIRALFAATPAAKEDGLTPSYFSFNSGSGRCQRCQGAGFEKVEMQFLSDLFVKCPACDGTRFSAAARAYMLDGKAVHEVLDLTITEALDFFRAKSAPATAKLQLLADVGLGYLKLGQPLNTLSGGESQRLKLVAHLAERSGGAGGPPALAAKEKAGQAGRPRPLTSLLIFDEPTTGLHFDDIALLLGVFHRLVDAGHSLVVIEHNLDVIRNADWIIDLGPEAGADGGKLVAQGTPEAVAAIEGSHTGRFLQGVLAAQTNRPPTLHEAHTPHETSAAPNSPQIRAPHSALRNSSISVHGAREHNLKNISLEIPRDQFVVITGLSGSGKSTLAFDILFAEGQRRFLDSMSPYARQFAEQLEKPDVDHLAGLPPTVAIEQRLTRGGGKSTVATVTEVYHFLRLLYAKVGTQFCPQCDVPVTQRTVGEITEEIAAMAKKGAIKILATVVKGRKGFHTDIAETALRQGFSELLVDGQYMPAAGFKKLARFREHTIDVVIKALPRGASSLREIEKAVETALAQGKGALRVHYHMRRFRVFSSEMSCPGCGTSFEPLDPRLFSFNSPHGWCADCRGFGVVPERAKLETYGPDESLLAAELRDEMRESDDDAERPLVPCPTCEGSRLNAIARAVRVRDVRLEELATLSVAELKETVGGLSFTGRDAVIARDILAEISQRMQFMEKVGLGYLQLSRAARTLSGGESQRIRLAAQLGSNLRGVLYILDEPTIGLHPRDNVRLLDTLSALRDKGNSVIVVEHDEETMRRADRLYDMGPGAGMFGGEIVAEGTLAEVSAVKNSPTGRALKEPMIHPLRGERRTVQLASSQPVVLPSRQREEKASAPKSKAAKAKKTAQKKTVIDETRRLESHTTAGWLEGHTTHWLTLTGCRANNLRDLTLSIPLQRLTVITGVSGSGKSSFMRGVLEPAVRAALAPKKSGKTTPSLAWKSISGAGHLDAVYEVDQSPIGKTSRSTPATYIGVFDDIRKLFASVPEARMRGFTASRFSFNTEGGRCEACKGNGQVKLEMAFLPPSWLPCEECHGMRYNAGTLEVEYSGHNIGQVMKMTIDEAAAFFAPVPSIGRTLRLLAETGVGYLQLGQPSPTLSGGEAQRIKLVTELTRGLGRSERTRLRKNQTPKGSLYLIEEPTVGLHPQDVRRLIGVLHRLVDDGHTVAVIEHNLDVAAEADWLLDIGPEAGDGGGLLVAEGTPEHVSLSQESRTAPFLREVLKNQAT